MGTKRHKPEDMVAKLRQADVLIAQGQSVGDVIRALGVTEVTYYRWRKEFGGLNSAAIARFAQRVTHARGIPKRGGSEFPPAPPRPPPAGRKTRLGTRCVRPDAPCPSGLRSIPGKSPPRRP